MLLLGFWAGQLKILLHHYGEKSLVSYSSTALMLTHCYWLVLFLGTYVNMYTCLYIYIYICIYIFFFSFLERLEIWYCAILSEAFKSVRKFLKRKTWSPQTFDCPQLPDDADEHLPDDNPTEQDDKRDNSKLQLNSYSKSPVAGPGNMEIRQRSSSPSDSYKIPEPASQSVV